MVTGFFATATALRATTTSLREVCKVLEPGHDDETRKRHCLTEGARATELAAGGRRRRSAPDRGR